MLPQPILLLPILSLLAFSLVIANVPHVRRSSTAAVEGSGIKSDSEINITSPYSDAGARRAPTPLYLYYQWTDKYETGGHQLEFFCREYIEAWGVGSTLSQFRDRLGEIRYKRSPKIVLDPFQCTQKKWTCAWGTEVEVCNRNYDSQELDRSYIAWIGDRWIEFCRSHSTGNTHEQDTIFVYAGRVTSDNVTYLQFTHNNEC